MNDVIIPGDVEISSGNPAVDFLRRACALFYRAQQIGDEIVKCPFCGENTPELWRHFMAVTSWTGDVLQVPTFSITMEPADERFYNAEVSIAWMVCPSETCKEIIVRITRELSRTRDALFTPGFKFKEQWLAVPRKPFPRPIDPIVGDPYRNDYFEASAILADSPRMSATLSRRILADLLEKYAGRSEYLLATRIDNFIDDPRYPSNIKDNLHYLREIGDFAAHTQKDKQTDEIINASPEEAEWTLDVIDSLFEYFIVAPERDRIRREGIDKKNERAGRKPIKGRNAGEAAKSNAKDKNGA
jgi:hypothetical protein